MPLSTLLNRPVTIIRRYPSASKDAYGKRIMSEKHTETVGELQQIQRDEQALQGETSDTDWLLILPAGTTIDTGDRVEIDPDVYEVIGAPWPARNPRTQAESHVEATLRRTAGQGAGS